MEEFLIDLLKDMVKTCVSKGTYDKLLKPILDRDTLEGAYKKALDDWSKTHDNVNKFKDKMDEWKDCFLASYYTTDWNGGSPEVEEFFHLWKEEIADGIKSNLQLLVDYDGKLYERINTAEINIRQGNVKLYNQVLALRKGLQQAIDSKQSHEKIVDEVNRKLSSIQDYIVSHNLDEKLIADTFSEVPNYVSRYVISKEESNGFARYIFPKHETLFEKIISPSATTNKYILLDEGQAGKSTELNNLAYQLQQDGRFFPIIKRAKEKRNLSKDDLPHCDFYLGKQVVLLIDAIDEFSKEQRTSFISWIDNYAEQHPDMVIVMTCRSNYDRDNYFESFQKIVFDYLTEEQWEAIIRNKCGEREGKLLIRQIKQKDLLEYMRVPFNVINIANNYAESGEVLDTKAKIYDSFVTSKLKTDQREIREYGDELAYEGKKHLTKIAFIMQCSSDEFSLNYSDFQDCIGYDKDVENLCMRSDFIAFDAEKGIYSFKENTYREFLVAELLSKLPFEEILSIIKHDKLDEIRENWLNVTVLTLSILFQKDDKNDFQKLISWIESNEKDFLLHVAKQMLHKDVRIKLVIDKLESYKKRNQSLPVFNNNLGRILIDFADGPELYKYFINAIDREKDYSDISKHIYNVYVLMMLCNLSMAPKEIQKKLTDLIFYVITRHQVAIKPSSYTAYTPLYNSFFYNRETVDRLIEIVKDNHDRNCVTSAITLIGNADVTDDYFQYVLDHEQDLHNIDDGPSSTTIVSRDCIYDTLKKAKKEDTILKILQYFSIEDHFYYFEDIKKPVSMITELLDKIGDIKVSEDYSNQILNVYQNLQKQYILERDPDLIKAFNEYFHKKVDCRQKLNESMDRLRTLYKNDAQYPDFHVAITELYVFEDNNNIDDFFANANAKSDVDKWLAEKLQSIPLENIHSHVHKKRIETFGEEAPQPTIEERRINQIDKLVDYEQLKKTVLAAMRNEPNDIKDLLKSVNGNRLHTSPYVIRFCHFCSPYVFNFAMIMGKILDKDVYYRFLLNVMFEERGNKDIYNRLNGLGTRELCVMATLILAEIGKMQIKASLTKPELAATRLFLDDKLQLPWNNVLPLLVISYVAKDSYNEDTVFKKIVENAEGQGKDQELEAEICNRIMSGNRIQDKNYALWASYLIELVHTDLYDRFFQWINSCNESWLNSKILSSFMANNEGQAYVKERYKDLRIDLRLMVMNIIDEKKLDTKWIVDNDTDMTVYEPGKYILKGVLRFMVYHGSMPALYYICQHLSYDYITFEYAYSYDNSQATAGLISIMNYLFKHNETFNCSSNLALSLSNIAIANPAIRETIVQQMEKWAKQGYSSFYTVIDNIRRESAKREDVNINYPFALKKYNEALGIISKAL